MVPEQAALIVADAGPLIVLSRIGRLDLLREVFGQVWITDIVREELLDAGSFPGQAELAAALGNWLHAVHVEMAGWQAINPHIDHGEASSICLAERKPGSLLVIDDRAGRSEAQARDLPYIGLVGVVRRAKLVGLIPLARPILLELRQAGYFLGNKLIEDLLRSLGEAS